MIVVPELLVTDFVYTIHMCHFAGLLVIILYFRLLYKQFIRNRMKNIKRREVEWIRTTRRTYATSSKSY